SALAGGNRRHADQDVALIDAGSLRLERYDDQKRLAVGGGVIGRLELSGPEGHFLDNALRIAVGLACSCNGRQTKQMRSRQESDRDSRRCGENVGTGSGADAV